MIKCCICGKSINENESNNAMPYIDGRCCDICNINFVIPYRIDLLYDSLKGGKNEK